MSSLASQAKYRRLPVDWQARKKGDSIDVRWREDRGHDAEVLLP